MKKRFLALALGTLAFGVTLGGVKMGLGHQDAMMVKATEGYDTIYTLDTTNSDNRTTNNGYGKTGTVTVNDIEWTFTGNGQVQPWRLGGKTANSGDQPFYTNTAFANAINRIEVTFGTSEVTFNFFPRPSTTRRRTRLPEATLSLHSRT